MASLNSCSFTGRAGRDPEVRYFEDGKIVANLSIAIDSRKRDEKPLWLPLKIWGKQAQVAADYIRKGNQFAVTGELENETWTDRTSGEEKSRPVLNVRALTLLGGNRRDDETAPTSTPAAANASSPFDRNPMDDEIPF